MITLHIENSYSFVNSISQVNNADRLYMVSFDVQNLFTNIPVYETIDICLKYLFPDSNSKGFRTEQRFFLNFIRAQCNSFLILDFTSKLMGWVKGCRAAGSNLCKYIYVPSQKKTGCRIAHLILNLYFTKDILTILF